MLVYGLGSHSSRGSKLHKLRHEPEFCQDIVANLKEVGVSVTARSMTECSLQVLGGATAKFERSYGTALNVRVKSNPYRMFVTRGDNDVGTCYVLHPRKTTRRVKDRDC